MTASAGDLRAAVRELREHYRDHRRDDCDTCLLWLAWTRQDIAAIDAIIERNQIADAPTLDEALIGTLRAHRAEWGEAGWTARDLPGEPS